jgi:amino acid transporter
MLAAIKRFIIGKPLKTEQLHEEKLPIWKALPILSSDALSSVAYGTEQLLTVLAPIGVLALWYSLPISAVIIGLLAVLVLSYRQVIFEYPGGGGAYIVSHENLGWFAGLIAGASLLVDYTLTCAVSVAAGTDALTSAFPQLHRHGTLISVFFVILIMLLNLRGVRESGTIFAFPTYLFIMGIVVLVAFGLADLFLHGLPRQAPPITKHFPAGLTWFLVLRAFSSGCSAVTGVEAISNATPTFRAPEAKNAARTLALLGLLLAILFGGISLMAYMYHITPNPRKTVLSQVAEHVFGRTFPYYYIQSTTALILILAANTAFSGFPLLASIMAKDKFMPRMFNNRGDRLNFSNGIILLAFAAIALIVLFNGDIDRLIPLYAIGVFLSFTLAQSGLVYRWWRKRSTRWISKLAVNALGAVVTLIVLLIFAITKFDEGAWIVIIVIPIMIFLFYQIRRHYNAVAEQLRVNIKEVKPTDRVQKEHLIIVPVGGINQVVVNTLSYAKKLNGEIVALYVAFDEEEVKKMESRWKEWNPGVRLVVTRSRFRSVIHPLMRLIHKVEAKERQVTVLIPEFIPLKWWHRLLHNQTALMLRFVLLIRTHVVIATVPFHLHK